MEQKMQTPTKYDETTEYAAMFDKIDELWQNNYGDGQEYCHEQSFSWGFQEGAGWAQGESIHKDIAYKAFNNVLGGIIDSGFDMSIDWLYRFKKEIDSLK